MASLFETDCIRYSETGKFSKTVLDYVSGANTLRPFYEHPVNIEGIKAAVSDRKKNGTNRQLLVDQLLLQYEGVQTGEQVKANIQSLLTEDTFTICTAHQPNIFTGHLYFIYKIAHVIKIASFLNKEIPDNHFVPVFFVGSEDADLAELNHVTVDGKLYQWNTNQTGAVGRMKVDKALLALIDDMSGRLKAEAFGEQLVEMIRTCYKENTTIERATFLFVNQLFQRYGLLVLLPDNAAFKRETLSIFEEDIFNNSSSGIVEQTSDALAKNYKAQAHARDINLFYLKDSIRNRIIRSGERFLVDQTEIVFTGDELKKELHDNPERFSPNVILRGLFQETILPGVAFVGGGGELAYWLQLKDLFKHFETPFPVLVLRNSALILQQKYVDRCRRLRITPRDLFKPEIEVLNDLVRRDNGEITSLEVEMNDLRSIFDQLATKAGDIDPTLSDHVAALHAQQNKKLLALEKKMKRAARNKLTAEKNQLDILLRTLFPDGGLQERTENFMLFYALWGDAFITNVVDHSLVFEQLFCILSEKPAQ